MKFKVRIILNIKHSSDMPQAVSPYSNLNYRHRNNSIYQ